MLIDQYLPYYDATAVQERQVNAPADITYATIRETDLTDPVINALFAIRELPDRIARKWRGKPPRHDGQTPITFGNLLKSEMGWVLLAEEPGTEFVVGSVGRFWCSDYGSKQVSQEEFIGFAEPDYVKLAVSFRVEPADDGKSCLRYEARTAALSETARRRFLRYWRIIHLGVAIVMGRALQLIAEEAEQRAGATAAAAAST